MLCTYLSKAVYWLLVIAVIVTCQKQSVADVIEFNLIICNYSLIVETILTNVINEIPT